MNGIWRQCLAIICSLQKLQYLVSLDRVNEVTRRALQIIKWAGHVKAKRFCLVSRYIFWFGDNVLSVKRTYTVGSECIRMFVCISILSCYAGKMEFSELGMELIMVQGKIWVSLYPLVFSWVQILNFF